MHDQLELGISDCDGIPCVNTLVGTLTFDAHGDALYFADVAYDPTEIGTKYYFQARAEQFSVREVRIEDPDQS